MKLEQAVLTCLQDTKKDYLSGEELAQHLGVSREAVWKAVEKLRRNGTRIEAVRRRGYRLHDETALRRSWILEALEHKKLELTLVQEVDSTNTVVKRWAEEGRPHGQVLLAERQTAGRGRMGRQFYSPEATGLYLSLLLRPACSARQAAYFTTCAAVAAAEAIEAVTGCTAQIKWVNDVFCNGKKVCGILTEAQIDLETGQLRYAVLGIGVNLAEPAEGFPRELQGVAGGIVKRTTGRMRCQLAAQILDRFLDYYGEPDSQHLYEAYKKRLFLLGRRLRVCSGSEQYEATAVDLDRSFNLIVALGDGTTKALGAGEVHLLPQTGHWQTKEQRC